MRRSGLTLALLVLGCQSAAPLGSPCSRPAQCAASLVCSIGHCRAACRSSRDCDPSERCLVEPATGLGVCSLTVADGCVRGDECAAGFLCVSGECLNACGEIVRCPDGICVGGACITVAGDAGPIPGDAGVDAAAPPGDADTDAGPPCHGPACDPVVDLAMQADRSFAVTASGAVWGWGSSQSAGLGDGLVAHPGCADCAPSPVRALDETGAPFGDVIEIAASTNDTCVRRRDGTIWCWGLGRIVPAQEAPIHGATSLVAGRSHFCALVGTASEVWCWGDNGGGMLGTGDTAPRDEAVHASVLPDGAAALALGFATTEVLYPDGHVLAVGNDECTLLGGPTPSADALTPIPAPLAGITSLAVTFWDTAALTSGGELRAWGYAGYQPSVLGQTTEVFANCAGCCSGDDPCTSTPQVILQPASAPLVRLFGGGTFSFFGVTAAGELYAWGGGDQAPFGRTPAPRRVALPPGTIVADVSVDRHACALTGTGDVFCWGYDEHGQLGRGTTGGLDPFPRPVIW